MIEACVSICRILATSLKIVTFISPLAQTQLKPVDTLLLMRVCRMRYKYIPTPPEFFTQICSQPEGYIVAADQKII